MKSSQITRVAPPESREEPDSRIVELGDADLEVAGGLSFRDISDGTSKTVMFGETSGAARPARKPSQWYWAWPFAR